MRMKTLVPSREDVKLARRPSWAENEVSAIIHYDLKTWLLTGRIRCLLYETDRNARYDGHHLDSFLPSTSSYGASYIRCPASSDTSAASSSRQMQRPGRSPRELFCEQSLPMEFVTTSHPVSGLDFLTDQLAKQITVTSLHLRDGTYSRKHRFRVS